jgi:hypothetical protein
MLFETLGGRGVCPSTTTQEFKANAGAAVISVMLATMVAAIVPDQATTGDRLIDPRSKQVNHPRPPRRSD